MSDLHEELALLRQHAEPPPDAGEETRQRVLQSLDRAANARRTRRTVGFMAACLATSSALAYYLVATREVHEQPQRPERQTSVPHAAPVPEVTRTPSADKPVEVSPRAVPARKKRRAVPTPLVVQEDSAVSDVAAPAPDPKQQAGLYATAQRLHFRGAPHAALDAWDAFLAAAAPGPLASEARYNRAVTLLRLGRTSEARDALVPFARGDFADFRKADAALLLRQLTMGAPTR